MGGFGDIFDSFFGGGGSSRNNNGPRRGADIEYTVRLTFEEAISGVEKEISVTRSENCETCHGSGAKPGTTPKTCPSCHGSGQIRVQRQTPLGSFVSTTTCDQCHGTGKIIEEACPTCKGKGKVKVHKTLEVKVPAGVDTGDHLRVPGKGDAGYNGGANGDLYLEYYVAEHPIFKRDGIDIYLELPESL